MNRFLFATIVAAAFALVAAATAGEPIAGTIRSTPAGIVLSVQAEKKEYLLAFIMDGDGEAQAIDAIERGVKRASVAGSVRISEHTGKRILRVAKIEYLEEK